MAIVETCPPLALRLSGTVRTALAPFDLSVLETETYTIYALGPNFELGYMNPAWFKFADENNGSGVRTRFTLGVEVVRGIAPPLQDKYVSCLQRAQISGEPIEDNYLCPSPSLARTFRLRVLPLPAGGWLVHNALLVERPHDEPEYVFNESYKDARGLIVQCCSCRRVRHGTDTNRWDWVPSLLDSEPGPISHGLCTPCLGFAFPPAP